MARGNAPVREENTMAYTAAPYAPSTDFERFAEWVTGQWRGRSLDDCLAHRAELGARIEKLRGYAARSQPQDAELDDANGTVVILDGLISEKTAAARSATISRGMAAMADPGNLEGPESGSRPGGAPALVTRLGDQPETAQQIIARSGNPWAVRSGPLDGHAGYGRGDTAAGVISRAHDALSALEGTQPGQLPREGCERLAQAFAESSGWPGMTVKRSRDEMAEAAELFLSLSNPHYHEAFRSVLRYPMEFMGNGGTGFETFTDEQRGAWRDVRTNMAVRAAFAETSGAAGGFALPLQLDSTVMVTNAGVVGPFRKLARTVIGTSNVWEGITSAGSTANWVAEGAAVTDTTPVLAQVAITPFKSAVWVFASLEIAGDTSLDQQVPGLIAEARSRLELTSFTTGTGSAQPFGVITRGASDATVGALTAAMIYGMHQNLPPRFRSYDTARPAWISNVTIQDACRQLPTFAGSVQSMLNDNQPGDSPPQMLGIDYYEASAMDASNAVSGHKNLMLGDFSQMILVERLPAVMIYDPLVLAQASALPSGQVGWYSYARVGADITTPAAAYGSNAFVFHTT
jgi:HK97 family phage major capsid protein